MAQHHIGGMPGAGHTLCGAHHYYVEYVRDAEQFLKIEQESQQIKSILKQPAIEWTVDEIVKPSIPQELLEKYISTQFFSLAPPSPILLAVYEQAEKVRKYNQGWPWRMESEQLVTRAPYAPFKLPVNQVLPDGTSREVYHTNFKRPKSKQDIALFYSAELRELVFPKLLRYHSAFSALAATCQEAFEVVGFFCDHFNITGRELLDDGHGPVIPGNYVIVSPFRTTGHQLISAKHQLRGLQNLTTSVALYGFHLQILHLHRIPMLSIDVLNLIIPKMINLEVLGIYRCPLIHVGHLKFLLNLLELIRPNSTHRARPALDFSPRWHQGPPGGMTYGVTWDDFGYNSALGVWQIVSQALTQAISQGVDLISVDSAFRQWLEMGLLAKVPETLEAILFEEEDPLQLAAMLDYGNTRGERLKVKRLGYRYYTCDACHVTQLGTFYSDWDLKACEEWYTTPLHCLGCKLITYLDSETDHDKKSHTHIVKEKWLKLSKSNLHHVEYENYVPQPYIKQNIHVAITQLQILRGLNAANNLDKKRGGTLLSQRQTYTRNGRAAPVLGEVAQAGRLSIW